MSVVDITFPGNLALVADIPSLRALPSSPLENDDAYLVATGGVFVWSSGSLAADDGYSVVMPNDLTPLQAGRWLGSDVSVFNRLASAIGSSLVGYQNGSAPAGSLAAKLSHIINVTDAPFNAALDGVTDDYPAFLAAYNVAPTGSTIYVPHTTAGFYLSAMPDDRTKAITWSIDGNTKMHGAGVGNVEPWGNGQFGSLITNPYLQVYGDNHRYALGGQRSPLGGALMGEAWELMPDPATGYPFTFTATVTAGSAVLTNCSGDLTVLYPGDRLDSTYTGWPNFPTATPYRIWEVDPVAKTITFGPDAGAGPAGPLAGGWTGATGTITVTAQKRNWFSLWYSGVTTGDPSNSGDMSYGLWNGVLNITGAPGDGVELDINSYHTADSICRGIFLTGSGTAANNLIAVDIQRAEMAWSCGVAMRGVTAGLFMNAQQPFSIDTTYGNPAGGTQTIDWGLRFNNIPVEKNALLEGSQLADGRSCISLFRATDTNPASGGRFFQAINAANTAELFSIFIDGSIQTLAPSNANGSTTNSGSILANGLTLRGTTNLQLGQTFTTGAPTATGYVTVYDSAGRAVKLLAA